MSDDRCLNCGHPEADQYDLMVRGNSHSGVYLCADCHDAIQDEMAEDR